MDDKTDSVRVPDNGPWRWHPSEPYVLQSDDFGHDARIEFSGDFADHDDVMRYKDWLLAKLNAAAPAQAGARDRPWQHLLSGDLEVFATQYPKTAERIRQAIYATPKPEQGAGLQTLADEWAHAIRNGVMDDGEGDGPMFYATEEWALNMLESIRALARQQSRGVDREMSGRLGDHLREKHGVMLSTQSLQAALRAALEGDRDGR